MSRLVRAFLSAVLAAARFAAAPVRAMKRAQLHDLIRNP